MQKIKILYVERKFHENFSLERVFRQIARSLSPENFTFNFEQVKFLSGFTGMIRNLLNYRPSKADVYHITGQINYIALILPPRNTILTIHDLRILVDRKGIRRFIIKKMLFDFPLRKLKYVTAISQTTKDEIVREIGCQPDKIRVVEVPLDENYQPVQKKSFNRECPQILQIGTAFHKNVPNVIRALEGINCRLVIIGKLNTEMLSLLKEKHINYQNEFDLDEESVKQHYQMADLTVFCSLSEGFGLPIIEAQAMRTPVITSNINPMTEVAGNGALFVNPNDFLEIRKAIVKIITDEKCRSQLVENGIENIRRFQHSTVAKKYENLYKEVFEENQI